MSKSEEVTTEKVAEAASEKASKSSGGSRIGADKVKSLGGEDFSFTGLFLHTEPHDDLEEIKKSWGVEEWQAHFIRAGKKALDYMLETDMVPLQKTLAADLFYGAKKLREGSEESEGSDEREESDSGYGDIEVE